MKKIKILSLLLALLTCASVLFVSCDKKEETLKISDIMNPEWKMEKDGVITSFKDASFTGDFVKASGKFLVTKYDPSTDKDAATAADGTKAGNVVTRVYDVTKNQAVATLTNSTTVTEEATTTENHYVHIISDKYFAVLTATTKNKSSSSGNYSNYFGCSLSPNCEYSLSIRNESGEPVETYYNAELLALCSGNISNFDNIYMGSSDTSSAKNAIVYEYRDVKYYSNSYYGFDLFAIGSKVYRFDNEYNVVLVKDYALADMPNLSNMSKVGDKYLEKYDGIYTVYDKDLNKVFGYTIPALAEESNVVLLTNGNLFVQYFVQLDQNEKDFDIRYGADGKYDLVTTLVTPEETVDLKDVNFVVSSVETNATTFDGKKVYADTVENLAFIYPINEDKMLDIGYANQKLVLLSNEGEVTAEVVADGIIVDFPIHYKDNFYAVYVAGGSFNIYDKTGELRGNLSSAAMGATEISDSYLLIDDVIYNTDGTVAYDIGKDHADYKICGDTVIIVKYATKSTAYGIFVDGQVKSIGTVSTDEKVESSIDSFSSSNMGYYYTFNKKDNKYTYYNSKGTVLGTFDNELSSCLTGEDFIIMHDAKNKIFYNFEITK